MGKPHPLLHTGGLPVQALRAQFPVLAQRIHGQPLAYLDNAATTHMPLAVQEALRRFDDAMNGIAPEGGKKKRGLFGK